MTMPGGQSTGTGFHHFWNAMRYTMGGFRAMLGETAFRQELGAAVVLLPLPWLLKFGVDRSVFLNLLWIMVMLVEMVNTAVEAVVDLASPEWHPLAKKAKDIVSATVALAIACNAFAWGIFLWRYLRCRGCCP